MKGAAKFILRLYPEQWRARYGEELAAVIEDSAMGWRGMFDLMTGAVKMQMHVPAFPKLAVILSMLGLVTGLAVSTLVTPRYVSSAELEISYGPVAPAEGRVNLHERVISMEQEILSRTSLAQIIQDPRLDLYKSERAHAPLEDVIEEMRRRDIQIRFASSGADKVPFTISFAYSDRARTRDTVQALMTKFMDSNQVMQATQARVKSYQYADQIGRMEARIATLEKRLGIQSAPTKPPDQVPTAFNGINLDVLDVPNLPVKPEYPDPYRFMAIGFGAGFAAAVVIAIFRRRPPPVPFPAQTA